jgi:hypothetical protein
MSSSQDQEARAVPAPDVEAAKRAPPANLDNLPEPVIKSSTSSSSDHGRTVNDQSNGVRRPATHDFRFRAPPVQLIRFNHLLGRTSGQPLPESTLLDRDQVADGQDKVYQRRVITNIVL